MTCPLTPHLGPPSIHSDVNAHVYVSVSNRRGQFGAWDYTSEERPSYLSGPMLPVLARDTIAQGCWCIRVSATPDSHRSSEGGKTTVH